MIASPRHLRQPSFVSDRDRQLHAAAVEILSNSQYTPLRQLNCRVTEGVVEITGTVSTFYLKQLAQAAMLRIREAGGVQNLVEVVDESPVSVATDCASSR